VVDLSPAPPPDARVGVGVASRTVTLVVRSPTETGYSPADWNTTCWERVTDSPGASWTSRSVSCRPAAVSVIVPPAGWSAGFSTTARTRTRSPIRTVPGTCRSVILGSAGDRTVTRRVDSPSRSVVFPGASNGTVHESVVDSPGASLPDRVPIARSPPRSVAAYVPGASPVFAATARTTTRSSVASVGSRSPVVVR